MADEDDDKPNPWTEEAIEEGLAKAVERHFPEMAALVSPEEAADLKPACLRAFRHVMYAWEDETPEVVFGEKVPETVKKVVARPEDMRQAIAEYRILQHVSALGSWIHGYARQAVKKTLDLTPELRAALGEKNQELMAVLRDLKAKHPHMEDSRLPRPTLTLVFPRMMGINLSNVIGDFRLVEDYPNGRIMSIEMAHEAGLIGKASKGETPAPEGKGAGPQ